MGNLVSSPQIFYESKVAQNNKVFLNIKGENDFESCDYIDKTISTYLISNLI